MNDNCITKVVGFRRIAMGSLVRRYIVTKGQVKPLLDACIIFPTLDDARIHMGIPKPSMTYAYTRVPL